MIIPKERFSVAIVIQAGSEKGDADQTIQKRRKFINVLNL